METLITRRSSRNAGLALLLHVLLAPSFAATNAPATDRPLLAIWRDSEGHRSGSTAPYLRIAIWQDGRILFAKDARKWGHELREARIDSKRLAELTNAIGRTGVFDLPGNCYLVPDGPVDCVMLDFGERKQMLYWDEVELPGYGINLSLKPRHGRFKSTWKKVNQSALALIPRESQPYERRFERPPASWRLKPQIQSE